MSTSLREEFKEKYLSKKTKTAGRPEVHCVIDDIFNTLTEKIEGMKKRWHIRWEGLDNPEEVAKRKEFNDEVSLLINSALDDVKALLTK